VPRRHRQNRTTQNGHNYQRVAALAWLQCSSQHSTHIQTFISPSPKVPPFLPVTIMTSSSVPATAVTSPAHQTAHHPQPAVSIANFPSAQPVPPTSHNCMFLSTQPDTYLDIFQEVSPSIFYNLTLLPHFRYIPSPS
jgi:hypothetical protein